MCHVRILLLTKRRDSRSGRPPTLESALVFPPAHLHASLPGRVCAACVSHPGCWPSAGGTRAESVMAGYACTTGASSFVGFVLLSIPICYIYLLGTLPRRVTGCPRMSDRWMGGVCDVWRCLGRLGWSSLATSYSGALLVLFELVECFRSLHSLAPNPQHLLS